MSTPKTILFEVSTQLNTSIEVEIPGLSFIADIAIYLDVESRAEFTKIEIENYRNVTFLGKLLDPDQFKILSNTFDKADIQIHRMMDKATNELFTELFDPKKNLDYFTERTVNVKFNILTEEFSESFDDEDEDESEN